MLALLRRLQQNHRRHGSGRSPPIQYEIDESFASAKSQTHDVPSRLKAVHMPRAKTSHTPRKKNNPAPRFRSHRRGRTANRQLHEPFIPSFSQPPTSRVISSIAPRFYTPIVNASGTKNTFETRTCYVCYRQASHERRHELQKTSSCISSGYEDQSSNDRHLTISVLSPEPTRRRKKVLKQ